MPKKQQDAELIPIGYYEDPARRCVFALENTTKDVRGLAFAVLLRAVEDGCNPQWLIEIAKFYEIEVPDGLFNRPLNRRVKDRGSSDFIPIETMATLASPLLEWEDSLNLARA